MPCSEDKHQLQAIIKDSCLKSYSCLKFRAIDQLFFFFFPYISNTAGVIIMTLTAPTLLDRFTGYIDSVNVPLWLFRKKVPF